MPTDEILPEDIGGEVDAQHRREDPDGDVTAKDPNVGAAGVGPAANADFGDDLSDVDDSDDSEGMLGDDPALLPPLEDDPS